MKLSELEFQVSTLQPKEGECLLLTLADPLTKDQLEKFHARLSNIGLNNRLLVLHSGATLESLAKQDIDNLCDQLRGLVKGEVNPL